MANEYRFRWVECQFESLKRCPRSESHLDHCLRSLPQGLDETYEQILCRIDEESIEEARRILTMLCFSCRPLTVPELIDSIAVDLNKPARLDPRRRLQDADDLREICPGLIEINTIVDDEILLRTNMIKRGTLIVRIAHFSVQEYLKSDRIKQQRAAAFGLKGSAAHAQIAQICLVYLQEPGLSSGNLGQTKLKEFPLAHFAAMYWHHHYKNTDSNTSLLDSLILSMFRDRQSSFSTWVRLRKVDERPIIRRRLWSNSSNIASPVYYASFLGLDGIVHELLNICQHNTAERQDLVNAKDGYFGNPLQVASLGGHDKIVQMLINAGADVNAQVYVDQYYDNALQAASGGGHKKVVQILLDAGADVNAQGGECGNALQAASGGGHEKVVQMLMDAGADVNTQGGEYGNALQAASEEGNEKAVQMLINAGADVNAQGEEWGNALQAASRGGHEKVVQMLMDAGADVNAQGGRYGNALQAASGNGREKVVQMLINAGADVNAQGGIYGNALQAASGNGREKVVQMLMDAGADVNAQGGRYGNALQAASGNGREKVVQMLMDAGADVNAQGEEWGNALQAASRGGHEKVVQMLMDAGADVNAQGGRYGNALQAASGNGREKVVQMLINAGADVNAQGGIYGNALQAASIKGRKKVVQILLAAGAVE